jgi:putative DNA primase/helicase
MPDFSTAMTQEEAASRGDDWDWDAMSAALTDCADRWVRELFPRGVIADGKMRLANIAGAPPHGDGSCVIELTGDKAGYWYDHSLEKGGRPVSTVKEALGLSGADLWRYCNELLERNGGRIGASAKWDPDRSTKQQQNAFNEIQDRLNRSVPYHGSVAETYLRRRTGVAPAAVDLLFNPDVCRNRTEARGFATLIARLRYPSGELSGGIHQTFLLDDGSHHVGDKKAKMMLGEGLCSGTVIMLGLIDPAAGVLGVGEGIETTLAGMRYFDVPGWSAISAGGLKIFGDHLKATGGMVAAGPDQPMTRLQRLLIFADRGEGGEKAGWYLYCAARALGIAVELYLPTGADDLCDDLANGRPRPEPLTEPEQDDAPTEATESEVLPSLQEVSDAIDALTKESDPESIKAVIEKLAAARLGTLWDGPLISRIKERTSSQSITTLRGVLKDAQRRREPTQAPQQQQAVATTHWRGGLITNDKEEPRAITANVLIALTRDPTWAGVLALNEFTGFITIRRQPPFGKFVKERAWRDADTRITTVWMQKVADIPAQSHVVFEGVATVAELSPYHPVRDYLNGLVWDQVPRIDDLFVTYFGGIGDAPDERDGDEALDHWKRRYAYYQAVGARSLIGAVARIYEPGCKNDCSPTLVGDQGTLKSTSIKVLFSEPWFTDEISEFGSKDAAMQTAGVWGIEIGELVAAKRDIDKTKAFMSRSTDRFRPPYGKVVIEQPRQCVFWGTTNRDVFLFDETGNRRMWSVRCGEIDVKRLKADRDQLWAEAVFRFNAKESWWLHEPELIATAAEVQAEFVEEDPWNDIVLSFATCKNSVGIDEMLAHIGIIPQDRTQVHSNRVARILRMAGWTRKQEQIDGRRVWRYFNHAVHQYD